MKAWVLHETGDIRFETTDNPKPGRGEVLVAVKAAGICGSDIPRIYQTGAHRMPLIPGHEFSGVVQATGPDVALSWQGKRVGVFPLLPCRSCAPCREKRYEMCRNYDYIGSRRNGAFAEYVSVPTWNLINLPDPVAYEEAAMLEPMAVAVHAMRQALPVQAWYKTLPAKTSANQMHADQTEADPINADGISVQDGAAGFFAKPGTIVVCGLGTIGQLLLMFLLEAQNRQKESTVAVGKADFSTAKTLPFTAPEKILAIGNKDSQRQKALQMGLSEDCFCDIRKEDAAAWLRERTDGAGAGVFFECVGKNETISLAVSHTSFGGRIVLVGNPYSDLRLEKTVYWKILRDQLTVKGTWNSSFTHASEDDWHYALQLLSGKQIAPAGLISHRLPLRELENGLWIMRDKSEEYGKVMVIA